MSFGVPQGKNLLLGWKKWSMMESNIGRNLPDAYKKFWAEWKHQLPVAVHYIPKEGTYVRNEKTGIVTTVQNVPIPIKFPPEAHDQMWGGEGVIKGFQKRTPTKHRVPHFWVPTIKRSVVYSAILNQYMSVILTDRALHLIHEAHGFDHYLLKTPACDLKQMLPMRIKRRLLKALLAGCPDHKDDPVKQAETLKEYKAYLEQYTPEEIDWYGYTYPEALRKLLEHQIAEDKPVPYKHIFRQKLIEQFKEAAAKQAEGKEEAEEEGKSQSWMSKINPFSKSTKTEV